MSGGSGDSQNGENESSDLCSVCQDGSEVSVS